MDTEPRNFGTGSYPLGGEKIGPAWRTLWKALSATRWASVDDLCRVTEAHQLSPITIHNLLRKARAVGQLEVRHVLRAGRRRSEYRVKKSS